MNERGNASQYSMSPSKRSAVGDYTCVQNWGNDTPRQSRNGKKRREKVARHWSVKAKDCGGERKVVQAI